MKRARARDFYPSNMGLLATTEHAIKASELAGQTDIVEARDRLPIDSRGDAPHIVRLGPPIDGLFRRVRFPEGWRLVACEGTPYWSVLRDDVGRKRASVFYKAAFYDMKARIVWEPLERTWTIPAVSRARAPEKPWPVLGKLIGDARFRLDRVGEVRVLSGYIVRETDGKLFAYAEYRCCAKSGFGRRRTGIDPPEDIEDAIAFIFDRRSDEAEPDR